MAVLLLLLSLKLFPVMFLHLSLLDLHKITVASTEPSVHFNVSKGPVSAPDGIRKSM